MYHGLSVRKQGTDAVIIKGTGTQAREIMGMPRGGRSCCGSGQGIGSRGCPVVDGIVSGDISSPGYGRRGASRCRRRSQGQSDSHSGKGAFRMGDDLSGGQIGFDAVKILGGGK